MDQLNNPDNQWIIDMFKKDYGNDLDGNKKSFLIKIINSVNLASDRSVAINNLAQFMGVMNSRKSNKINNKVFIVNIVLALINVIFLTINILIPIYKK
jgi:hypothetical protein